MLKQQKGKKKSVRKDLNAKKDVVIKKIVRDHGKNDTSRTLISVFASLLAYFGFEIVSYVC